MGRALVILGVLVVGLILVALALRQRRADASVRAHLRRALEAHGAARCVAAIAVLRQLRDLAGGETVAGAWDALELPLLEALPDCPPASKVVLREVLEDVAQRCRKRDVARRLMIMRDAVAGLAESS